MAGNYKLTDEDKKFVLADKRIKDVKQRTDGVIELHTNNITMYYIGGHGYDTDRSQFKQAQLGEVKVEVNMLGRPGSIPFRITNPSPKGRYDGIHHPMFEYYYKDRITCGSGCLGSYGNAFRGAFARQDIVEIVTIILASMEHVYNHGSRYWDWTYING